MKALKFTEATSDLRLIDVEVPVPAANEALIKISRAGICSTDLHILKGYVPGFDHFLGHEFVGTVTACASQPELVGKRVVGEINCRCGEFHHPDPIFVRNHAPQRTVLGIIGKDGCMAEYCSLPVENLHLVPDDITDKEACFAEPLAAACRIAEQQVVQPGEAVAVCGDGKLGLLIAQVLAISGHNVTFFGRHERKMALVEGVKRVVVTEGPLPAEYGGAFDVTIEASGAPAGIRRALELTSCMGTVVVKSTCSTQIDREMPPWSAVGNDVVVNEKRLVGSRCGPFPPALEALRDERMKKLVEAMVDLEAPLEEGVQAMEVAGRKGTMKVQLVMG